MSSLPPAKRLAYLSIRAIPAISIDAYLGASSNTPLRGAATRRIMPTRDESAATRTVTQGTASNSMAQYG